MSNKYLLVRNTDGFVSNVIAWDGIEPYHVDGYTLMVKPEEPLGVWIGWSYIDGEWVSPQFDSEPE